MMMMMMMIINSQAQLKHGSRNGLLHTHAPIEGNNQPPYHKTGKDTHLLQAEDALLPAGHSIQGGRLWEVKFERGSPQLVVALSLRLDLQPVVAVVPRSMKQ